MRITDPIPPTNPIQQCAHCRSMCNTWLWCEIESYPRPLYEKLCTACHAVQLFGFTAERAICQAEGITKFHAAVLSGRCERADWNAE